MKMMIFLEFISVIVTKFLMETVSTSLVGVKGSPADMISKCWRSFIKSNSSMFSSDVKKL